MPTGGILGNLNGLEGNRFSSHSGLLFEHVGCSLAAITEAARRNSTRRRYSLPYAGLTADASGQVSKRSATKRPGKMDCRSCHVRRHGIEPGEPVPDREQIRGSDAHALDI